MQSPSFPLTSSGWIMGNDLFPMKERFVAAFHRNRPQPVRKMNSFSVPVWSAEILDTGKVEKIEALLGPGRQGRLLVLHIRGDSVLVVPNSFHSSEFHSHRTYYAIKVKQDSLDPLFSNKHIEAGAELRVGKYLGGGKNGEYFTFQVSHMCPEVSGTLASTSQSSLPRDRNWMRPKYIVEVLLCASEKRETKPEFSFLDFCVEVMRTLVFTLEIALGIHVFS